MPGPSHSSATRYCCLAGAALIALAGCGRNPPRPSPQKVLEILAKRVPFAKNSFYTCLLNGYAQGLPFKQIQADCENKLGYADQKGFGRGDLLGDFGRKNNAFDPSKVSGACNAGDPGLGKGSVVDGVGNTQWNYADGRHIDWGKNSWGGKDKCDADGCYKGLKEDDSREQKNQAIKDYDKARQEWLDAEDEAKANPQDAAKRAEANRLKKVADEKAEKAMKDPNKKDPPPPAKKPSTHPVGPGGSPCEQALEDAREFLGECQRTGWAHSSCQSFLDKMKSCPEPELIYVDPDAGYACRQKVDPEAFKQAWVDRCHELKRPVPGGPDPCAPPEVDRFGRFVTPGSPVSFCGDPLAHIDPDSPDCLGTLTIQQFAPNAQTLLVWGLNKLGGPIVVLTNPKPQPGDGPTPKPPGPKPDPKP
jgi:hypothetical protein